MGSQEAEVANAWPVSPSFPHQWSRAASWLEKLFCGTTLATWWRSQMAGSFQHFPVKVRMNHVLEYLHLRVSDSSLKGWSQEGKEAGQLPWTICIQVLGPVAPAELLPIFPRCWQCTAWSWRSAVLAVDGVVTPRHGEGCFHLDFHRFLTFSRCETNWHCRHCLRPRHTLKALLWLLWNVSAKD